MTENIYIFVVTFFYKTTRLSIEILDKINLHRISLNLNFGVRNGSMQ